MSHAQRIRQLVPRLNQNGNFIPDESFYQALPPTIKEWLEKMELAVKSAKEAITKFFSNFQKTSTYSAEEEEDGSSKDDRSCQGQNLIVDKFNGISEAEAHMFVSQLPTHLLLTTSFNVDGTDTSQSKLGPCSANKIWALVATVPATSRLNTQLC